MNIDYLPPACFTGLNQKIRSPQVGGFHFPVKYAPANEGTEFVKMKEIPLTQGKVALVDDEDFDWLSQWKWYAHNPYKTKWYARSSLRIEKNKFIILIMHRLLLNNPSSLIDHRDGNGLNNQRGNLRLCTDAQNQANQHQIRGRSKYKGVHKDRNRWMATISLNGKQLFLGNRDNEIEAARLYDAKAIELFGAFACTNEMLGLYARQSDLKPKGKV